MTRCQFIYIRARGDQVAGGQCELSAEFVGDTLCAVHRHFRAGSRAGVEHAAVFQAPVGVSSTHLDDFPRLSSPEEVKAWVDEARLKTNPVQNKSRGCIICGRATVDAEMAAITISDLVALKELLTETLKGFLQHVDPAIFQYTGCLAAASGLPIDKSGILTVDETVIGSPVIGNGCWACYKAISRRQIPEFALGNRLWTGIEVETPLTDLTWIEEKLIARVHVSVQIQKCRMFSVWAADGFHPQRQVQGHILSYPMEPTVVLNQLPLAPNKLIGLIKIVFLSRKPVVRGDASKLRFYIVRRQKVVEALCWLIEHNPCYRDVRLDPNAIAQLPLDGIPDEVYEQIMFSDRGKDDVKGHSRYDAPDAGAPALMQCCGVLDVEGTTVSSAQKVRQALHGIYLPHSPDQHRLLPTHFPTHLYRGAELSELGSELVTIPHSGEAFANEYETDHVYKAFPKVFRFAVGGFNDPERNKKLSWEAQMKWMLEQSHGKFAEHEIFMFVIFNIIQRRKICLGAKLMTSRVNLPHVARLLRGMDYAKVQGLIGAEIASGRVHSLSDPVLHQLMDCTAIANGLVRGSQQYIQDRRNEIRALFVRFGGPKFFVTINPDDMRHPLVLSLRGDAATTCRPVLTAQFSRYWQGRARLVAENPVLQAQFFDLIFSAVIDILFGFGRDSRVGIFGKVAAHYDIIEAQGKGTLHAHGLVWTADGINPKELWTRLQDDEFRAKLIAYLESIVKLDFDWTDDPDEATVYGLDKAEHPGFQFPDYEDGARPLSGASQDISETFPRWSQQFEYDAKAIAVATQTHRHTATCRKKGTACRFGFGGEGKSLCQATTVDLGSGEICLKRGNANANNHNPLIAAVTRSNHDLKPTFLSGFKSLQSMYYMTTYVSKFDDDISDAVIMESAWKGLERDRILPTTDDRARLNRLITRLAYLRQSSLQFSGAQVAAMFLGIGKDGTHYTNCGFSKIGLYGFINYYNSAETKNSRVIISHANTLPYEGESESDDETEEYISLFESMAHDSDQSQTHEALDESILGVTRDDTVMNSTTTQATTPLYIQDYIFRGQELDEYSVYELAAITSAKATTRREMDRYLMRGTEPSHRGPAWNRHVFFLPEHLKADSRWISFLRRPKVPVIVGPSIPHSETIDQGEKRAFLLLLLFKPWRKNSDMKASAEQSWADALADFERECEQSGRADRMQLLCNVDTLCKSRKDAEEERKETSDSAGAANNERELQSGWRDEENEHVDYLGRETAAQAECLDVAAVEKYLTYNNPRITSFPNHCFVSSALLAAKSLGVLPSNRVSAEFFSTACVSRFEHSDENRPRSFHVPDGVTEATAEAWKERIGNEVLKLRQRRRSSSAESTSQATIGSTVASSSDHSQYGTMTRNECIDAIFKNVSTQFGLNEAQCRAYDLFLKPLKRRLTSQPTSGHEVDNRCMYLGGAGGTGKSRVIEAIIEAVRQLDCTEQLLVCATTGIAASLINGSTVDSLLKLRRGRTRYKEGDDLQQANNEASYSNIIDNTWMTCNSLILDEVSMLGCSKVTSISKTLEKNKSNSLAFGGVNILFCGDFHQLPAIGDVSLFRKASTTRKDSEAVKLGMYLWSQVTKTTVLLKEHYRAPDPTVYQVMERLRRGALTAADIEKIKSRVFGHPEGPDPSDVKWQDAPLITPRNTIRQAWNNLAAVRYGIRTQKQVFLSPSIDLGVQCDRDAMIWTGDHKTDMLATWNVLCIDAMAIVTANIAVEMKIAKGSRVIIREVVPHPEDHEGWRTIHSHQVVRLARPPITVFVEPVISESQQSYNYHRRNHPTWFPIMAMKQTITIPKEFGGESVSTCDKTTFDRIQIPLTSGFSMSDFRVQGSGLNKGIFDLKKPPTGRMVLQNIYTMLSRVSNWEDLAILRPFEDCVLQLRVDDELTEYDETLERMDLETQRRVAMEET